MPVVRPITARMHDVRDVRDSATEHVFVDRLQPGMAAVILPEPDQTASLDKEDRRSIGPLQDLHDLRRDIPEGSVVRNNAWEVWRPLRIHGHGLAFKEERVSECTLLVIRVWDHRFLHTGLPGDVRAGRSSVG